MSDTIGMLCLVREGGQCFRCGTDRGPFNCHHRLGSGLGPDTPENRLTLCGFGNNLRDADGRVWCHGWVHQNSARARSPENGWIISRYDPRPPQQVPVRHHALGLVYVTPGARLVPVDLVTAWTADGREPLTDEDLDLLGGPGDARLQSRPARVHRQ